MATLRSRRLEALFGSSLDNVDENGIQGLVTSGAQESFDLDFKRDLYGNGDSEARKLAGDVAALANTAGGVIVLGVDEDDQARATDPCGIELSEAEVARMRQMIASRTAPMPIFEINAVPIARPADPERTGFYIISVPRSTSAPHAVLVNDALRYPKRNGSTTRYLSEPEVAAAYHERSTGRAERGQKASKAEKYAVARLNLSRSPWLLVSIIPELSGEMNISMSTYRNFQEEMTAAGVDPTHNANFHRFTTDTDRLIADGGYGDSSSEYGLLECYRDGSGVFAVELHTLRVPEYATDDENSVRIVADEWVTYGLISGLLHLGKHARDRAATNGLATVRAQLVFIQGSPKLFGIGNNRTGFNTHGTKLVRPPEVSSTVVDIDTISTPSRDLMIVVKQLSNQIFQGFGIPESMQITDAGEMRKGAWKYRELLAWADHSQIPVV
ncbi:AlbA family DNA-binding domain-containing protein [Amycolatopsis sp. NPDC003731]